MMIICPRHFRLSDDRKECVLTFSAKLTGATEKVDHNILIKASFEKNYPVFHTELRPYRHAKLCRHINKRVLLGGKFGMEFFIQGLMFF